MSASIIDTLRAAGCVFAEDEARLLLASAATAAELDAMVRQRVLGLPLEHIVGWAEFCGLRIAVDPGVFVPRRRTELLVREAVAVLCPPGEDVGTQSDGVGPRGDGVGPRGDGVGTRGDGVGTRGDGVGPRGEAPRPQATVVDLGCGSGAVGAALRCLVSIDLHSVDIDPVAAECARRTLGPVVLVGDLYQPLPANLRGQVDVIVANAPYVPTDAIRLLAPEARLHEALVALDGGADGLAVVRRVIAGAPSWLAPGGHLLIETSEDQAPLVSELMVHHGLSTRVSQRDDLGATVVVGRLSGLAAAPNTCRNPTR